MSADDPTKSTNRISKRQLRCCIWLSKSVVCTDSHRRPIIFCTSTKHAQCAANEPPTPHLSSRLHWKWMEDRSSSTPVLSGSCLHSCMQWRSAASKSPDWYSRCASSANPWKESIRFVGSGAPTQPKEGGNNMLDVMEEIRQMKTKNKEMKEM